MTDYKFTDGIVLIHKDGKRWEFKDIYEAVNTFVKWRIICYYDGSHPSVGEHFGPITKYNWETRETEVTGHIKYIIRTEFGEVITDVDLEKVRNEKRAQRRRYYTEKEIERDERDFRCAPAPYTRCRRGGGGWYRKIRTYGEHRETVALLHDEDAIEYDVKPRAKRNTHNLPNSWDDFTRSDYRNHNWKRQRKTQWKEKK